MFWTSRQCSKQWIIFAGHQLEALEGKDQTKKQNKKNRKAIKEKNRRQGIGIIDSYGVQNQASHENRENKEGIMILNNAQRL